MKIIEVKSLEFFPDIKVIKCQRFADNRGYFTEPYRSSEFPIKQKFVQMNESFSKAGVMRGLHFQWSPFMGKLVRVVSGSMTDLFLDIRKCSKTFGMISDYKITQPAGGNTFEWIWIPVGYAHGNYFHQDTILEYMCSGEYAGPNKEAAIWALSGDINRQYLSEEMQDKFSNPDNLNISDKDKAGMSLSAWVNKPESRLFEIINHPELPLRV